MEEIENDNDNEIEKVKPTEEELDDFKLKVSEWVKLDEQVRKLMIAIRERKIHQRVLSEYIQNFMNKFNYDNLNTQHGVIKNNTRNVKQQLKIKDIRGKILELGDEPIRPSEIIEKILDCDLPIISKKNLKRIQPKVSFSLEI